MRDGNQYWNGRTPNGPATHLGETWIEREELAYATPTGSPHGSRRRARVRFVDGKLRIVRVGVPDTWFTIPAKDPRTGRTGYITILGQNSSEGEWCFLMAGQGDLGKHRVRLGQDPLTGLPHTDTREG